MVLYVSFFFFAVSQGAPKFVGSWSPGLLLDELGDAEGNEVPLSPAKNTRVLNVCFFLKRRQRHTYPKKGQGGKILPTKTSYLWMKKTHA